MAERLGTGLQNLLQRFDSAWHLPKTSEKSLVFEYICLITGISQSSNAPCRLNASEGRCCWAWSVKFLDKV